MRKDEDRLFKGSVFVEFASVDEAKALVDQESLKYNEEELIKMTKWVVNNTEQFFFSIWGHVHSENIFCPH